MRKSFFFKFSLLALSLSPWNFEGLIAEETLELAVKDFEPIGEKESIKDGYKINFNNVSIIEYIRFVSKITGTNFVFDEAELQFNVTIVSEEPISTRNIMSALIQVLRIHGLTFLEQENNFIITTNVAVNQIPTIVFAEVDKKDVEKAPLVTRIFRLKNASPSTIGGLIKPMVSTSAIIEAFEPTRQLIVTDIATNVDKMGQLLVSLDTPHSPLEIETFTAKHVVPAQLIALATKIVSPFADTNPLLFVPQPETNTIFIISTPNLIERAMTVMEDLDRPVSKSKHALSTGSDFLMYQPKYRTGKEVVHGVEEIGKKLQDSGLADAALLRSIHTMKWVPQTSSILFTGDAETLKKIQEVLSDADIPPGATIGGKSNFIIYKPHTQSVDFIQESVKSIAKDLKESGLMDPDFLQTLTTMRHIPATNSLLLTGTPDSLKKSEELIATFDVTTPESLAGLHQKSVSGSHVLNYILYTPKYLSGPDLIGVMRDFAKTLVEARVSDRTLFDSINNLRWMEQTSSLIVSGDPETIKKMEALLAKFDIPSAGKTGLPPSIESIENTSFLVYKLQYHQGTDILTAIKQVANELSKASATATKNLVDAINSLQWISVTNSLIATGDQEVLTKLQDLIRSLDVPLKQVFIEVLIIETTLSNIQNYGLQWGGFAKYMNKVGVGYGNFPGQNPFTPGVPPSTALQPGLQAVNATSFPNPNTQIPFTQGFDLGSIGDIIMHKGRSFISLGALVTALQTDADSTVLLNPKIITQDTNNSTIFVGQNIPYTGSTLNVQGGVNTSTTSNIEYRDIGMNLSITPYLGNEDIITLEISNDISQQIAPAPGQNIPANGILTTHTSLNTRVHVPDKHFVVLSGMITDTKQHFKSGIPCLGGLPVIGAAFSQNNRTVAKDNLIIFIRPQIIHNFAEYKEVTDHQEDLYKDQAVLPILKEEFDEAINVVKQPENE